MDMAGYPDIINIKAEELKTPREVSDDVRTQVKEEGDACKRGNSYMSNKCEGIAAGVLHVEVKEEEVLHSLPGPSGTQMGESSHQGHPCRARSVKSRRKMFNCSDCGKGFTCHTNLKIHTRVHTGDKPFHCMECGKSFSIKGNLMTHTRIHTGDKPFQCMECGKRFRLSLGLKTHTRVHTGDKPFQCVECGKSFSQLPHLRKHTSIHTGDKPFHCVECGKSFSTRGNLMTHASIHTGDKPFQCLECGKSFSRPGSLKAHKKIHKGDTPFQCLECQKCFRYSSNLQQHLKVHTRDKPNSFDYIRTFKQYDHLKRHREIHIGKRQLECYYCGDTFSRRYWLKEHITHNCGQTDPLAQ